ncbi:CHRD domain-containing protein [Candidatus Acetothermia bacterium]|nr:CHRD domain-containing protein [Candidatus Acetothermia bacterium]
MQNPIFLRQVWILTLIVVAGIFGNLGAVNALAGDCLKIGAQGGLNPYIFKNEDMPNPDEAKNATCGGVMTFTFISRVRTLNVITSTDNTSVQTTGVLFDSLTTGTIPALAEAFEVKNTCPCASASGTITRGQEVPSPRPLPVNYRGGVGIASLRLDQARLEVAYRISYSNLTGPARAIHFHRAKTGEAGPVIRTICAGDCPTGGALNPQQPNVSVPSVTVEGVWKGSDKEPLTKDFFDALLNGDLYVNIHTEQNPAGEVRAQANPIPSGGQAVTFTIRKGVKFSNGDPVTAEDVRFTYENLIFPKDIATSTRDVIACGDSKLPTIRVEASNKITFTCARARSHFVGIMGSIVIFNKKKVLELVPNVERSPKDFNTALGLTTPLDKLVGIGTSNYILTKLDPNAVAEYKRNPFFWETDEKGNQLPYLDGIRILFAPTQGQEIALAQFRNGQTDFVRPRSEDIAVLQSDKASKNFPVNDDIDSGMAVFGTTFWVVSWTTKNPTLRALFNSREFRQAMSMITDRATIKKNILLGLGVEQYSHIPVNSQFFIERLGQDLNVLNRWEQTAKFPFAPRKADELLDKVGLVKGPDGIRIVPANFQGRGNPAGKLEFTLNTNVGNTIREEMIKQIAGDARKIGVKIKPEPMDFQAEVDKLNAGDYEAILIGLTSSSAPEVGVNVYLCDGNLHFWNVDCPKNATESEKQIDALYRQASATLDVEEQRKLFDDAQIMFGADQPLIHIVEGNSLFAYRTDTIKNHGSHPLDNLDVVYCLNGKCRGG